MDWFHCNSCYKVPSKRSYKFFLTACGHLLCSECVKKSSDSSTPSLTNVCRVCNRKMKFYEINQSMSAKYQMLFRDPRKMASDFGSKWKKVMEFQSYQRTRLNKHRAAQYARAAKQMKFMETELLNYTGRKDSIANERDKYKAQCEEELRVIQVLEQHLTQQANEVMMMRRQQSSPTDDHSDETSNQFSSAMNMTTTFFNEEQIFTNLNGSIQLSEFSMTGVPTSTPIKQNPNMCNANLVLENSPVVIAGGGKNRLSAPVFSELRQQSLPSVSLIAPRGSNFFNI